MKFLLPYLGLRVAAGLMRITSFRVIGLLSGGVAFILHRMLRYRRSVAIHNLQCCFPEKSESELRKLLPSVYLNITDVFFETIKAFSLSPAGIVKFIELPPKAQLDSFHAHFKGGIIATAHIANWEWCGYSLHEILQVPGIAVYRPLKNARVDKMMRTHREKSRMTIVPMRQIVKLLAGGSATSHFVLLIADQSPDPDGAQWENFFGIQTAFFKGPAALATRYHVPVFFVYLERMRRHRYRMHLEPLCLDPGSYDTVKITHMYVQKLEQLIRNAPENWLWTHRRWKHTPAASALVK